MEVYFPGATVGLIGESIGTAILAQELGRLGYRVASLVTNETNRIRQFASWQTISPTYNDQVLTYFAKRVDLVYIENGLLSASQYYIIGQLTDITLSDDLLALTTDRLLEKNYIESHNFMVAPYTLVTSLSDIQEAVESIGFPCVLKSTQRDVDQAQDHLVLSGEEDYPAASQKLQISACLLESWIPSEHQVSITATRNARGEMLIYPVFETDRSSNKPGKIVRYPANIHPAVSQEMHRIAQVLTERLGVRGALTIKCFVTSSSLIYINDIVIDLADEAIFTIGSMSVSQFEATARAIVGLSLPVLKIEHPAAIALPLEQLNMESVETQLMLRTDWGFAIFSPIDPEKDIVTGQVIVTGDSIQSCKRQLDITDLLK